MPSEKDEPADAHGEDPDLSAPIDEPALDSSSDIPFLRDPVNLLRAALDQTTPAGAWQEPDADALNIPGYRVVGMLGRGGMGAVYEGIHEDLDRRVAIKILPPELAGDLEFEARFRREARSMAKLNHPNIVQIYDFGQTGEREFYLVMEYVDGSDLHKLLKAGKIDEKTALQLIGQICDALQYAHDEGFVHRDIKPANIILNSKGQVKVGDFGLAKIVAPNSDTETGYDGLTGSGVSMGTPQYMAPEQMSGSGEVDHRVDIYSLGVMFYELLTGEIPRGSFPPPSKKVAKFDQQIDDIVLKAMASEPEQRYQAASDVRKDVNTVFTQFFEKGNRKSTRKKTLVLPFMLALIIAGLVIAGTLMLKPREDQKSLPKGTVKFGGSRNVSLTTIEAELGDRIEVPIDNDVSMFFRFVPAGSFLMGDIGNKSEKSIGRGFWIAETETTQRQWHAIMKSNPSGFVGDSLPVESISRADSIMYAEKLRENWEKAGILDSEWNLRLPTETEWECACRAGTNTNFYWGNEYQEGLANFENSRLKDKQKAFFTRQGKAVEMTMEVSSFPPNPWGIYSMHGNVREMCLDQYDHNDIGTPKRRSELADRELFCLRGGSFNQPYQVARSSNRGYYWPGLLGDDIGFRLVLIQSDGNASTISPMELPPSLAALTKHGGRLKIWATSNCKLNEGWIDPFLERTAHYTDFTSILFPPGIYSRADNLSVARLHHADSIKKLDWASFTYGGNHEGEILYRLKEIPEFEIARKRLPDVVEVAEEGGYPKWMMFRSSTGQVTAAWTNEYLQKISRGDADCREILEILHKVDNARSILAHGEVGIVVLSTGRPLFFRIGKGMINVADQVSDLVDVAIGPTIDGRNHWIGLQSNGELIGWDSSGHLTTDKFIPQDLPPACKIRSYLSLSAIQTKDGSWYAWGDDSFGMVTKINSLPPSIDLAFTRYSQGEGIISWIEFDDAKAIAETLPPALAAMKNRGGTLHAWVEQGGEAPDLSAATGFTDMQLILSAGKAWKVLRTDGKVVSPMGGRGSDRNDIVAGNGDGFITRNGKLMWRTLDRDSVRDFAATQSHGIILKENGSVETHSWRMENSTGSLDAVFTELESIDDAVAVDFSNSGLTGALIKSDGTVKCWAIPKGFEDPPDDFRDFIDVATGNHTWFGLKADGTVKAFTRGGVAQKALEKIPDFTAPVVAVRAANQCAAAQLNTGEWIAWGNADNGMVERVNRIGKAIDLHFIDDGTGVFWIEPEE